MTRCIAPSGDDGVSGTQSSFAAGTLVWAKHGLVPIEQIKVGDWVLSYLDDQLPPDRFRGEDEYTYRQVSQTFVAEDQPVSKLIVRNLATGDSETIWVTACHPMYCKNRGWIPVSEMHATDVVEDYQFRNLWVGRVYLDQARARVHNFEIDEFHTYYVGSHGVWVHSR